MRGLARHKVPPPMVRIEFDQGTLTLHGNPDALAPVAQYVLWDERTQCFRSEGIHYGPILLTLHKLKIPFTDNARRFATHPLAPHNDPPPRPHQKEAIEAWIAADRRGVVVLPTGAGKTLVAHMAIAHVRRDTLVIVPTIDLMMQWHDRLGQSFGLTIGLLGGGSRTLETITVSTYDSAIIHMDRIGNRFGLIIFDECHHLPATSSRLMATMAIAPFRLGLTATPERSDGTDGDLIHLIGPLCHRSEIADLEGEFLSPYLLESIPIYLDDDERTAYDAAYQQYYEFKRASGISFRDPHGWSQFVKLCARSQEGRQAYAAYRMQRKIAFASRAKLRAIWRLLVRHRQERILLFTDDNATAYTIAETFFLPVITHNTRAGERARLLEAFRDGSLPYLVNSRILNEGIDVPDVAVGIIVSGRGSVREHVQRLGRILRPRAGKQAILYEMVSEDTRETFTAERRRQHAAYQKSTPEITG
ncbi:MAG: DEAD/DEAH box helicase family protein [Magnetococcales bacterium]|nr:DEAD/DEAH box helicase family protein [Magnetococcales bacterium]MBF0421235.1 DEAD/DEAH box helicase family protein [Magnetococcales bacterium]